MGERFFAARMYFSLLRLHLKTLAQYRADFWASLAGVLLLNGANVAQMAVISLRFQTVGSWGVGDLMVLYGMFMLSYSLFSIFFPKLSKIENEIVSGSFDVYLLRPVSPFLQLAGGEIRYTGLCDTLMGALLLGGGAAAAGVRWGVGQYLLLLLFILSGGVIVVCIRFLISCVTFWTTKAGALGSIFTQIVLLTQKYPITIFGPAFRLLVTAVVPVAFLNFYPAAALLGKPDAPLWLCMLSPAVAALLVAIAALVWKRGLLRYGSSGG